MNGSRLTLVLLLTAITACGTQATDTAQTAPTTITSTPVTTTTEPDCDTTLFHTPNDAVTSVAVVGDFNDWSPTTHVMSRNSDGVYSISLDLPSGNYPYKFLETVDFSHDQAEFWVCDPAAKLAHCESGYKEPSDYEWSHQCISGQNSDCNSLLVVPNCDKPTLTLTNLAIDRTSGGVTFSLAQNHTTPVTTTATIDGQPFTVNWQNSTASINLNDLSAGHHYISVTITDEFGVASDPLTIPLWLDDAPDDAWRAGSVYWAFIDRVANGDTANDAPQGTTHTISDYNGGDFTGLEAFLPYLDDLGVTVLWISNPQENAPDAWDGDCDATYSGYHAYWPGEARQVQPQFGTKEELQSLIDAAHDRGMRVIMDWVGNHLHETHPWVNKHPDWFNPQAICNDSDNWNTIPESCWFAPYLPDIDYAQPDALVAMIDEALWWATTFQLDGFRVDAVKHMSHAVHINLNAEIDRQLEHAAVGGDSNFLTIGETFDSQAAISAYISDTELDGQFDFPMYWTVTDVFAGQYATLDSLVNAANNAADSYPGAFMSNFLGNHDVIRFSTLAAEGNVGSCWDDNWLAQAYAPTDSNVYDRLILAWSWLFTQPAPPTIYYGDEFAIPGYTDPDNRQPLWWHTGGDLTGVDSVDAMMSRVSTDQGRVLQAVKALANARKDNPVLWRGSTTEWWAAPMDAPNLLALARVDQESGGEMILAINRSWDTVTLTNGLSFAGLSTDGQWFDVLSGDSFTANSDSLSFTVAPYQARLLLRE